MVRRRAVSNLVARHDHKTTTGRQGAVSPTGEGRKERQSRPTPSVPRPHSPGSTCVRTRLAWLPRYIAKSENTVGHTNRARPLSRRIGKTGRLSRSFEQCDSVTIANLPWEREVRSTILRLEVCRNTRLKGCPMVPGRRMRTSPPRRLLGYNRGVSSGRAGRRNDPRRSGIRVRRAHRHVGGDIGKWADHAVALVELLAEGRP